MDDNGLMTNFRLSDIRAYLGSSLLARAFSGCFIATHVPIIVLIAYVASGAPVSPRAVLVIILLATLVGTAMAFVFMRHLLLPIGHLARDLRLYRLEGRVPALAKSREDDIGHLTDEVRDLIGALEDKIAGLKSQAFSDTLTGLGNRRWLAEIAGTEIARARRDGRPLSVVVFDLDHFKRINDDFGHEAGDEVLIAVAETARRVLRPYDLIARLGGEEFGAFLPGTDLKDAILIAERLRAEITGLRLDRLEGRPVTASFGIHAADVANEQFKAMLSAADEHLYKAKRAGRNQVQAGPARAIMTWQSPERSR